MILHGDTWQIARNRMNAAVAHRSGEKNTIAVTGAVKNPTIAAAEAESGTAGVSGTVNAVRHTAPNMEAEGIMAAGAVESCRLWKPKRLRLAK
jgi:hypothetical protein